MLLQCSLVEHHVAHSLQTQLAQHNVVRDNQRAS